MMFGAAALFSLSTGRWWEKETQPEGGLISSLLEYGLRTLSGHYVWATAPLTPCQVCSQDPTGTPNTVPFGQKLMLEVTI